MHAVVCTLREPAIELVVTGTIGSRWWHWTHYLWLLVKVEKRWKVVGSCHEKVLVLKCITLVILILKQGTKFDHNGDSKRECYVCSIEVLNKYTIMSSCKDCQLHVERVEVYFLLNNRRGILNSFKMVSIVNIGACALISTQRIDWL